MSLALCAQRGKFLYEARPDIVPFDYLSNLELHLWELYYQSQQR